MPFLYLGFWSRLQMIVEPLCEDAGYGEEWEKQQSHHSLPHIDLVMNATCIKIRAVITLLSEE